MTPAIVTNRLGQRLAVEEARSVVNHPRIDIFPQQCWRNSVAVFKRLYRKDPTARYVEGHALSNRGLVVEHGWVEAGEGDAYRIIDPTPVWHEERTDETDWGCYFAAKRYTLGDVPAPSTLRSSGSVPLVHKRKWLGWRDEEYVESYFRAWAYHLGCSAEAARAFLQHGDMTLLNAERKAS